MRTFKHFKVSEFACPCCGENHVSEKLIELLDEAREQAGLSFHINSGYRCDRHNAQVGGTSDSAHTEGLAADIACSDSRSRFRIVKALLEAGFTRVGIAKTFVHADIDGNKDPEVIWLY